MSILITGASGLAGSHLVKELADDHELIGIQRGNHSNLERMNLEQKITEKEVDVTDYQAVSDIISEYKPEKVIHLAAQTLTGVGREKPLETYRTNVMGALNVLESVRRSDTEPEILVQTTDKIFGATMEAEEDSRYKPTGPYGTSKIAQDAASLSYMETYGMDIKVLRSVNIYGYEAENRRIIPNTVVDCLNGQNPLIFNNLEGVRGYIQADDWAEALISIFGKPPGRYNIATGDVLGQEEVVRKILEFFPDLEPEYREKSGAEEIPRQSLSPSDLEWSPEYTFKQGIERTINDYRKYGGYSQES